MYSSKQSLTSSEGRECHFVLALVERHLPFVLDSKKVDVILRNIDDFYFVIDRLLSSILSINIDYNFTKLVCILTILTFRY